jgi:hypothetical protein
MQTHDHCRFNHFDSLHQQLRNISQFKLSVSAFLRKWSWNRKIDHVKKHRWWWIIFCFRNARKKHSSLIETQLFSTRIQQFSSKTFFHSYWIFIQNKWNFSQQFFQTMQIIFWKHHHLNFNIYSELNVWEIDFVLKMTIYKTLDSIFFNWEWIIISKRNQKHRFFSYHS